MPLLGTLYPKYFKSGTQTDTFMPMVFATSFTSAKRWEKPKCLATNKDKQNVVYTYNGIILSCKKKSSFDTCYV